ncbi:MAG: hypothetical protein V4513_06640 [Pseudomonadota bacterium]
MRKFLISMVAAGSAVAFAAPATAQYAQVWAPPVYSYQPYNFNYGFNGYNFARSMQARVQRIRGDIRVMQSRRVLSYGEARRLDREALNVERKIARASRYGINPYEARSVENSIRRLEQNVAREANDWNRRYGNRGGYRRY